VNPAELETTLKSVSVRNVNMNIVTGNEFFPKFQSGISNNVTRKCYKLHFSTHSPFTASLTAC